MCIWMCMIANHKHGLIRQTALSVLLPLDLWVALCIAHSAHFHWEKFCPPHKITRYYPVHWLCPAAGHQALLPGHCGMAWWWLLGQSSLECHFTICGFDVVTANCSWSPNGEQREVSFGSGLSGGRGKLPGRWGNGLLGWPEKWREETGLGKPYKGRKQWLGKSRCLHIILEIGLQSFPHSFHHLISAPAEMTPLYWFPEIPWESRGIAVSCTKKWAVCSITETPAKWLTDFLTDSSQTTCQWGIVIQLLFFYYYYLCIYFPREGAESIGMEPKALRAPISSLKWSIISLLTKYDGTTICNGEMTGKAWQSCKVIWSWWEPKCTQERPVPIDYGQQVQSIELPHPWRAPWAYAELAPEWAFVRLNLCW